MHPTRSLKRKAHSLEAIKREREGYHLDIRTPPRNKIHRVDGVSGPTTQKELVSASLAVCSPLQPGSPSNRHLHIDRGDSSTSLFISLGKAAVSVTRGDSGRHTLLFVQPSFWFTWRPADKTSGRLSEENPTEVVLEERVRLGVFHEEESTIHSIPYEFCRAIHSSAENRGPSPWNDDEEQGSGKERSGVTPTTEAVSTELYYYEALRVSKASHLPSLEYGLDSLNWISGLTPTLLAECFAKILMEECFLRGDINRYSFLYRGRHLLSETCPRLLFSNLLTQCMAGGQDSCHPIRVCVFCKF
ncbi:unnamed protein product [Phytomonas sp. EM1]|nr:unnamed protein product [Phytomonas sp. EM1]|eukprot:CCW62016.1 unnamed protein product [Phytomonas sp. isolate EM1]